MVPIIDTCAAEDLTLALKAIVRVDCKVLAAAA